MGNFRRLPAVIETVSSDVDSSRPQERSHQHPPLEVLSAHLDGRVESSERPVVEQHLADCSRCAAEMLSLQELQAMFRRLPEAKPPRSFVLPEPLPIRRNPRLVTWTRAAAALAAAFFVVMFSADMLGLGADGGPTMARSDRGAEPVTAVAPAARQAAGPEGKPAAAPAAQRSEAKPVTAGAAQPQDQGPATLSAPAQGAPAPMEAATSPAEDQSTGRVATLTPLRLAWIGTGVLTLGLILSAVLIRRRASQL